ncbi:MAG: hypothetical protein AB1567_09045 [bacterium]
MRYIKGTTLVEALIGFAGLGIILLMVYTIFLGGMKSWIIMTPQIDARKIAREILYGKTGEEWGGLVAEIKECDSISPQSPTAIDTSLTALNLITSYSTGTLVGTFAICYEWSSEYPVYDLDKSVSKIGTLTKSIWKLEGITWNFISKKVCANNIRMGSVTYATGDAYPLFRYYTGLGEEIDRLLIIPSINEIRQIGISMVFDIDNDRDGKFGEDPPGGGNSDYDRKLDEDRPNDFSIKTKVACMNLSLMTP